MKLLLRFCGLLAALGLLTLTLPGCAGTDQLTTGLSEPLDSSIHQQVTHKLGAHRLKVKGNLTVQLGTGNISTDAGQARAPVATGASQAQDNTKAGQHGGTIATAPGASAGATTRTGVPPWALVAGAVVGLLLLLTGLAYKFRRLIWPYGTG